MSPPKDNSKGKRKEVGPPSLSQSKDSQGPVEEAKEEKVNLQQEKAPGLFPIFTQKIRRANGDKNVKGNGKQTQGTKRQRGKRNATDTDWTRDALMDMRRRVKGSDIYRRMGKARIDSKPNVLSYPECLAHVRLEVITASSGVYTRLLEDTVHPHGSVDIIKGLLKELSTNRAATYREELLAQSSQFERNLALCIEAQSGYSKATVELDRLKTMNVKPGELKRREVEIKLKNEREMYEGVYQSASVELAVIGEMSSYSVSFVKLDELFKELVEQLDNSCRWIETLERDSGIVLTRKERREAVFREFSPHKDEIEVGRPVQFESFSNHYDIESFKDKIEELAYLVSLATDLKEWPAGTEFVKDRMYGILAILTTYNLKLQYEGQRGYSFLRYVQTKTAYNRLIQQILKTAPSIRESIYDEGIVMVGGKTSLLEGAKCALRLLKRTTKAAAFFAKASVRVAPLVKNINRDNVMTACSDMLGYGLKKINSAIAPEDEYGRPEQEKPTLTKLKAKVVQTCDGFEENGGDRKTSVTIRRQFDKELDLLWSFDVLNEVHTNGNNTNVVLPEGDTPHQQKLFRDLQIAADKLLLNKKKLIDMKDSIPGLLEHGYSPECVVFDLSTGMTLSGAGNTRPLFSAMCPGATLPRPKYVAQPANEGSDENMYAPVRIDNLAPSLIRQARHDLVASLDAEIAGKSNGKSNGKYTRKNSPPTPRWE
jgi:hypothetical protein